MKIPAFLKTARVKRNLAIAVAVVAVATVLFTFLQGHKFSHSATVARNQVQWSEKCTAAQAADSIFLGLTSYMDHSAVCETIVSALSTASCPKRVFVGVLHHGKAGIEQRYRDLAARRAMPDMLAHNLQFITSPPEVALGPGHARRKMITSLLGEHRFILLTHSHTVFSHGWDDQLITDLNNCPAGSRPVLTTCLTNVHPSTLSPSAVPVRTFPAVAPDEELYATGVPKLVAREARGPADATPQPVLFASSQLIFAANNGDEALRDALLGGPADLFLPYANDRRNDFLLTLRLWQAGMDFYAPTKGVARHIKAAPLSSTVGMRRKSDFGSPVTRSFVDTIVTTGVMIRLAQEAATLLQDDRQKWLEVFLEPPYRSVASSGAVPEITAITQKYIDEAIAAQDLPSGAAEKFEKSMAKAENIREYAGSNEERLEQYIRNPPPDGLRRLNTVGIANALRASPTTAFMFDTKTVYRTLTEFWASSGLDWPNRDVAGHTVLGVTSTVGEAELRDKFNDRASFLKEKALWCST
jgi:hypothetical protein